MPSASHLLLSLSKTGEWLFSFFLFSSLALRIYVGLSVKVNIQILKKRQHMWRKGESDSAEFLTKTKTDVC